MHLHNAERSGGRPHRVTLKVLAQHVGLATGTVSAVLNNTLAASSMPQHTRDRVWAAARELDYRPDFFARSLRGKRTFTIGVIAEVGDVYSAILLKGIEQHLGKHGFFFLAASHQHDAKVLESYSNLFMDRGVEGFIAVDAPVLKPLPLPTVAIAGRQSVQGVTNLGARPGPWGMARRTAFASTRAHRDCGDGGARQQFGLSRPDTRHSERITSTLHSFSPSSSDSARGRLRQSRSRIRVYQKAVGEASAIHRPACLQ